VNDLRHDTADPAGAHAPDLRESTQYDLPAVELEASFSFTATTHDGKVQAYRIDPNELRTVPMPDLRSPEARVLDAEARDLRQYPGRVDAELAVIREAIERIGDSVTVLMLERELRQLEGERRINGDE